MFTNQSKNNNNSYFMNLALLQARKNLGNTRENPSVGCVVTKKNTVIGVGVTGFNGRPHAEYNAIKFSKTNLNQANLYVTLEPCSHFGKTPPCTKFIINSGIKKVFFSINDKDVRSINKSSRILKKSKILVNKGILGNELNHFYRSYKKSKTSFLPFVTCKIAISKDFYTVNKKNKWITNKYSRGRVHLMRADHDCLITGINTIIRDNPRLTCRIEGLSNRSPSRIVLDTNLKIPLNSNIIKEANKYTTIIFFNKHNKKKIDKLKKLNIKLHKISLGYNGELDLTDSLIKSKELGFNRVFLESGTKLTKAFLHNNLVDDVCIFMSNNKLKKNGENYIGNDLKFIFKNKKVLKEKVNLFNDKLLVCKVK